MLRQAFRVVSALAPVALMLCGLVLCVLSLFTGQPFVNGLTIALGGSLWATDRDAARLRRRVDALETELTEAVQLGAETSAHIGEIVDIIAAGSKGKP